MILIIKNVGKDTTTQELTEYFNKLTKSFIPFLSHKVDRVQLYTLYDSKHNSYEYHALCYVKTFVHARKIINRSKVTLFNGRRLLMREFKMRENKLFGPHEHDRRRGKHIQIVQQMNISAYQRASRKF